MTTGSWFRGRQLNWNPDRQAVEQERQRWVMEKLAAENAVIQELTVDPDRAYDEHKRAFIETGDPEQYRLMLEYVR
jgi:hypothetical protein